MRPRARVEPERVAFARALADARRSADLSQEDLAGLLGVTQTAVSSWEIVVGKGKTPDHSMVFAIEQALGLTPATLSRRLGYCPPDFVIPNGQRKSGVKELFLTAEELNEEDRRLLYRMYCRFAAYRRAGK